MKDGTKAHKNLSGVKGSFNSYLLGFTFSIFLTLLAYYLVTEKVFEEWDLMGFVVLLGTLQVFVQLYFFLHMAEETKPYWNLFTFLFMWLVVVILIVGTLWIMWNLDYRVMPMGALL